MSYLNVKIVHSLPEADWRRFITENSNSNIFHTPEMFQVFSLTKGYRPVLWAVLINGCVRALLLSVQITLFESLPRLFSTRAIIHGGILYNPDVEGQQALRYLLSAYIRETKGTILFTEVRNINDVKSVHPVFLENGFIYEEHLNYLIDLTKSSDELFKSINKSGRKAIKRAQHRGVTVEEIHNRELIPIYYDLLMQTYQRARVPLTDMSFFEAVMDILVPKGMAKMFLARVDNLAAAVSLELPFKQGIFSMFSGYDSKFRHAYTNDLIVWCILEWGETNGYSCFDFGGAGRPSEKYGPREFKAKFGGTLVNFGRYTYVHNPLALALCRIIYWLYRYVIAIGVRRPVSDVFKKRPALPQNNVSGIE